MLYLFYINIKIILKNSFGPSTIPKSNRFNDSMKLKETNKLSDIDGVRPKTFYDKAARENSWQKSDIDGTVSLQLHWERNNTIDKCLLIDDIEGTRPKLKNSMLKTKRNINPLEPVYNLPTYTIMEPPIIKKAIEKEEIITTTTKLNIATRESNVIDDIIGSRPGWRPDYV